MRKCARHLIYGPPKSEVKIPAMESISLVFEEALTAEDADITILWAVGDHGDGQMFDGPGDYWGAGNVLAHAFYPYEGYGQFMGHIHFDDFEQWTVNYSSGETNFPDALAHEIGHTLGLSHTIKKQALMFPFYQNKPLDQIHLDIDDKCGINWAYIGPNDLCRYSWLLSEVLSRHLEKKSQHMLQPAAVDHEGGGSEWSDSPLGAKKELIRANLAGMPMPDCNIGPGGRMRKQLACLLRRRLSFPKAMAIPYANIVCRFFDGLRREFGSPATDNLYKVIRPFGVHSYFQPKKNILEVERAMEKALERDKSIQFDEAFFDQLIATYLGEGQNNGTNEKRQNNGTNEKRASLECQPVYKNAVYSSLLNADMQKQKHSKPVKIFQLFDSFGNDEKAQIFNCCSKESDNKPMVEFSGNCEANLQEAIISEMANGAFLVEYVHIWIRLLNLPKECRCPN